ncbi:MAG: hypothetical protein IPP04_00230 [Saprospiraceae bacterium]|nr:hypothetical protein [Saprospiraceae bacterium]
MGPLKFNIPEVIESAQLFNGRSFIGTKVDKQTFLNNSKDSRILHLAMHAITDDQNPDYSQLFLNLIRFSSLFSLMNSMSNSLNLS